MTQAGAGEVAAGSEDVALSALRARIAEVTPARLLTGRAGTSYPTSTLLALRADSAVARDAVGAELPLEEGPLADALRAAGTVSVSTRAGSLHEHLRRPDLGRLLAEDAVIAITEQCAEGVDVQVLIGDGLSPRAVATHVPVVLPDLLTQLGTRGATTNPPILLHRCRVGILNAIGAVLRPRAAVLLIGERPGLAYAESLSAYLAWDPAPGQTDADRVVLSGISAAHRQGLGAHRAAGAILDAIAARPGTVGLPSSVG